MTASPIRRIPRPGVRVGAWAAAVVALASAAAAAPKEKRRLAPDEICDAVLRCTKPLRHPRGKRLPLYVWRLLNAAPPEDDAGLEKMLGELDRRGIGFAATWNPRKKAESLASALRIGAAQKKLGLEVAVNANPCLHRFFNGDPKTAHVTAEGKRFFDTSFTKRVRIGCPFAVRHRYAPIRENVEYFARAYRERGIDVAIAFADWEIDGPIEWNGAWAAAKRCARCRKNIKNLDDFTAFQKAMRTVRCDMQKRCYAEPLKQRFPGILVGNYAVYGHDGYRYWYDWFEKYVEGAPFRADHGAKHRKWFDEFRLTGYTAAMPVVYAWRPSYAWTSFADTDYRWFYFMLKAASNAGEHTPHDVPVLSFVSCLGALSYGQDDNEAPFNVSKYEELLWHLLLRGTDTFFVYAGRGQLAEELAPAHRVYAAALAYKEFLDRGRPVCFAVPSEPGPIVSGLKLGRRVLVRRTDFTPTRKAVELKVGSKTLRVGRAAGKAQILTLE